MGRLRARRSVRRAAFIGCADAGAKPRRARAQPPASGVGSGDPGGVQRLQRRAVAAVDVGAQLQHAIATGTPPALSVADNVKTVALIEAGYLSMAEQRTVRLSEISTE